MGRAGRADGPPPRTRQETPATGRLRRAPLKLFAPRADQDPMASAIDPLGITSAVRARPRRLLGDVIVELGFCDRATIEEIVGEARASGRPMGQLLLEHEKVKPHELGIAIAERFGLQFVDLRGAEPDMTAMTLVPEAAVRRLEAVPFGFRPDGALLVAMVDPRNLLAVDDLAMLTDRSIVPVVVTRADLETLMARVGRFSDLGEGDEADDPADHEAARLAALEQAADDGPTVKLVRSIIAQGIEHGASDIHFDPDAAICGCATASTASCAT
jgi:type IV pilus assembly protein PilB